MYTACINLHISELTAQHIGLGSHRVQRAVWAVIFHAHALGAVELRGREAGVRTGERMGKRRRGEDARTS